MAEKPNYYAIIPASVRYDKKITPNAKLLYGEITALSNQQGYCWASTNYFQELYGVSRISIQKWLKSLEENNYISRSIVFKSDSKEVDKRVITIVSYPSKEKLTPPLTKVSDPSKEKLTDNNTFNNTSNKDLIGEQIPFSKIISYLNDKTGKRYKVTQKWKDLIKARWNEGQRLDDFTKVIDVKAEQWLNDEKMNQYLRPQTLFGNKFDEYLNEYHYQPTSRVESEIEETRRRLKEVYGDDFE